MDNENHRGRMTKVARCTHQVTSLLEAIAAAQTMAGNVEPFVPDLITQFSVNEEIDAINRAFDQAANRSRRLLDICRKIQKEQSSREI